MSFYFRPPKGLTNLHILEEVVIQRHKCYQNLNAPDVIQVISEMEYLMEDSIMDRLGHYLFRLTALKFTNFFYIFVENEVKLLDIRLNCYDLNDLRNFIKKLRNQAKQTLCIPESQKKLSQFYNVSADICSQMLNIGYLEHTNHEHQRCSECDNNYKIQVPFYFCLDLLVSRNVEISRGFLHVKPHQSKKLILSLYRYYLLLVLNEMKAKPSVKLAFEDERICDVIKLTQALFFKPCTSVENGKFDPSNIESEAMMFPLCMNHLYQMLKRDNRLGHNDRFHFSLFLKSIGMSMSNAMKFWEQAYSKQHASCSKCTHTWQNSEKRYIYGIRHMYGLEGSRRSYSCKSCYEIENAVFGINENGGCPFKHYDDIGLTATLKRQLSYSSEEIEVIIHQRKENSRKACLLHMKNTLSELNKSVPDKGIEYFSPADYYLLIKGLTNNGEGGNSSSTVT